jgi:cytochrome c biogenesis protein CcdA
VILLLATAVFLLPNLTLAQEEVCKTSITSFNLTPFAIVCGAAVDAINPCALSILILLMASMLIEGQRKRALLTGFSFIAAVYAAYFLMGIGALTLIRSHTLVYSGVFYKIIGIASIIFGLLNLKDYFWYGAGGFIMEVPQRWRPKMKEMIRGVTSPWGAFVIGLLISLFLLPCLSGPYVVVLGMIAAKATFLKGILYMVVYNLIFILPMSIVVVAMYFGLPPEKAENWRKNKIRLLHLIAGVILIALGVVILFGLL